MQPSSGSAPGPAAARQQPPGKRARRGGADTSVVKLSKEMSKVLRHAPPPGAMDPQGWVALPTLAAHLRSKPSEDAIRQVVSSNDKQRFVLDDTTDPPRIRAAQGHSVVLEAPVLEPVTDADALARAIHVTSDDGWRAIQESGELRRMSRTHIHFAVQPGHVRVNAWARVLLQLDLPAALAAGHTFGLSTNGVLLTEGPLPAKFVTRVSEEDLPPEWARDARVEAKKAPAGAASGGAGTGIAAATTATATTSPAPAAAPAAATAIRDATDRAGHGAEGNGGQSPTDQHAP